MLPECNAPPNLLFTPDGGIRKMKEAAEAAYSILPFGMHLLVRGLGSPLVTSLILAFPHVPSSTKIT
jgi:hypothetical protein